MRRPRSSTALAVARLVAGLAFAVVLIAAAGLLERTVSRGHGYEPPLADAGVCGQPPDGTPGNDACWHAPQPINTLTTAAGWHCPDADASCGSFSIRGPHTSIATRSLAAPLTPHRDIHRRSIPLLI